MARVQCLEQIEGFPTTHLAHDDSVRPVAQSCLQQVADGDGWQPGLFAAVYRWWEKDTEGKPIRRKAQLGNLDEYPNQSKAQAAADALRLTINEQTPRQQLKEITIATLVQHYREHEMPDVFSQKRPRIGTVCEHEEGRKSYST